MTSLHSSFAKTEPSTLGQNDSCTIYGHWTLWSRMYITLESLKRNFGEGKKGCCVLCEGNQTEYVHPVGYNTNSCAVTRLRRAGLATAV